MFDSGVSAKTLIEELQNEVDCALPIKNSCYVEWLNAFEQMLYSDIIAEQKEMCITKAASPIVVEELEHNAQESAPRFEDIHAVYIGGRQLIKTNLTSGDIFDYCYYKSDNKLYFKPHNGENVRLIYLVRPKLKTVDEGDNISNENVMIPPEFLPMVRAKLRGEAYLLSNEYGPASNWLADYNAQLETFKQWIASKTAAFGL